jgi:hypothetical protein
MGVSTMCYWLAGASLPGSDVSLYPWSTEMDPRTARGVRSI